VGGRGVRAAPFGVEQGREREADRWALLQCKRRSNEFESASKFKRFNSKSF
jgi:hypothetical protein